MKISSKILAYLILILGLLSCKNEAPEETTPELVVANFSLQGDAGLRVALNKKGQDEVSLSFDNKDTQSAYISINRRVYDLSPIGKATFSEDSKQMSVAYPKQKGNPITAIGFNFNKIKNNNKELTIEPKLAFGQAEAKNLKLPIISRAMPFDELFAPNKKHQLELIGNIIAIRLKNQFNKTIKIKRLSLQAPVLEDKIGFYMTLRFDQFDDKGEYPLLKYGNLKQKGLSKNFSLGEMPVLEAKGSKQDTSEYFYVWVMPSNDNSKKKLKLKYTIILDDKEINSQELEAKFYLKQKKGKAFTIPISNDTLDL